MLTLVRRSLVLAIMMFWLGGFTFYTAVVIHVGRRVLGSHIEQGFVTARVTPFLNLACGAALIVFAWDAWATRGRGWRRAGQTLTWIGIAATLGLLVWLHPRLDAYLDPQSFSIRAREEFYRVHWWYMQISTVQWACGLLYSFLTLWEWRDHDAIKPRDERNESRG